MEWDIEIKDSEFVPQNRKPVHSSCNERPTNSSAVLIIHRLSLFVIGRFDGFRFYEPYHLIP